MLPSHATLMSLYSDERAACRVNIRMFDIKEALANTVMVSYCTCIWLI